MGKPGHAMDVIYGSVEHDGVWRTAGIFCSLKFPERIDKYDFKIN